MDNPNSSVNFTSVGELILRLNGKSFSDFMTTGVLPKQVEQKWITAGLKGSEAHPCWNCAQSKVIMSVVIPFILDIKNTYGEGIMFVSDDSGLHFFMKTAPLFSIKKFALFCNTGTSRNLFARLEVELYTVDRVTTSHLWTARVPKQAFSSRKKGVTGLVPEVRKILMNDLYSPVTRDLLGKLMKHLCVGSAKLHRNGQRISRI